MDKDTHKVGKLIIDVMPRASGEIRIWERDPGPSGDGRSDVDCVSMNADGALLLLEWLEEHRDELKDLVVEKVLSKKRS